ncbi:ribbon-helix-helix domain-containing protein [Sphingomonas oleivorans]|uniref:ribbon-helix-helix domain-containing protein n=1 Tax=Sphingomonas oleivorans TaxID=1735121 RepID=UPI003C6ECF58
MSARRSAAAGSGPVKRSVMIAGHATSISLEPIFWTALAAAAAEEALPLNALVARIDAARVTEAQPPNLASAIRVWLFRRLQQGCRQKGPANFTDDSENLSQ